MDSVIHKEKQVIQKTPITRIAIRDGFLSLSDYPDGNLTANYSFLPSDILVVRNVMPFSSQLINAANNLDMWAESTIYTKDGKLTTNNSRNNSRISVKGSEIPDLLKFENLLKSVMHAAVKLFMMDNDYIKVTRDEGYQILKYEKNQHYHPHADSGKGVTHRSVSSVGFLNDTFKGGELYFPRQNTTIRPEAGSIVIFPSYYTHVHESLDVTEGTKYSVVTWFS